MSGVIKVEVSVSRRPWITTMSTLTETLIIPVITRKIFLKKVTTNTPSQRAQLDIALGNHALGAQSVSLIESDVTFPCLVT